jgi:hypothetical protein
MTNLTAPINWTTNAWHQIALTYSPTNSALYLDGLPIATNGLGTHFWPNRTERATGFTVGSDHNGNRQAHGQFDELETYNYPLSAAVISNNYQAYLSQDKDGDGLADFWEWSYFGEPGVNGYANPAGDGISNFEKSQNNLNPNQFDDARLGYWRFNNVPNWFDEQGLQPEIATGLLPVPSWSGDAVKISSSLAGVLGYPLNRTDGSSVILATNGSIRFWFKPDWTTGVNTPGQNSIDTIRLFELGRQSSDASYGWFALTIDPTGELLKFSTEANGVHADNIVYPINFNRKSWYQIVLTYTLTNSALYVNGQGLATNGWGLTNIPSPAVLAQGFHLGCSWDGIHQANGCFDELETFNYPLTASDIATNYQAIATLDSYGTGLPDVVKNAWGLRIDATDSDCDGLPDAWEIAHGLNPSDPGDATPALLAEYASGAITAAPDYTSIAAQTNMINIGFVTAAASAVGTPVSGAAVSSLGGSNVWNFCDMTPNYVGGIALRDGSGTLNGTKLYAYIGPCQNMFTKPIPSIVWSVMPNGVAFNAVQYHDFLTGNLDTDYLYGYNFYDNPYWAWVFAQGIWNGNGVYDNYLYFGQWYWNEWNSISSCSQSAPSGFGYVGVNGPSPLYFCFLSRICG